jgi:hypothetical protein
MVKKVNGENCKKIHILAIVTGYIILIQILATATPLNKNLE